MRIDIETGCAGYLPDLDEVIFARAIRRYVDNHSKGIWNRVVVHDISFGSVAPTIGTHAQYFDHLDTN
jgi:hypothetical protein